MYGQPSGYGSSYDQHSSSPASVNAYGQNQQGSVRNASGMASGLGSLDDYGRQSAQGSHTQNSGFGGINDPYARSTSGFGGHSGYGQQQGMTGQSSEDQLKAYNDSKTGPSPALGQPNRPGSAANSAGAPGAQSGMQHQHQQQSAFGQGYGGGYQGQNSHYGGLGGLGGQQQPQQHAQSNMGQQQQGSYGGYGGGFSQYGQSYGGNAARGGWGNSYQGH
jgi:hypothetical protein